MKRFLLLFLVLSFALKALVVTEQTQQYAEYIKRGDRDALKQANFDALSYQQRYALALYAYQCEQAVKQEQGTRITFTKIGLGLGAMAFAGIFIDRFIRGFKVDSTRFYAQRINGSCMHGISYDLGAGGPRKTDMIPETTIQMYTQKSRLYLTQGLAALTGSIGCVVESITGYYTDRHAYITRYVCQRCGVSYDHVAEWAKNHFFC